MVHLPTLAGETAVFGLGRSGLACVAALAASGNQLVAWDDDATPRAAAQELGVGIRNLLMDFGAPARLIISPGVPLTHPAPHAIVKAARTHGCAVLGDMDLFAMALEASGKRDKATLIGITGTNGKSTTTALIGHMLQQAGLDVHIGGNIGTPVLELPMPSDEGTVYVLELSSYQLDLNRQLVCDMGVLLNMTPDHLDRHGDMAGYQAAKEVLFANDNCAALRVMGVDDAASREIVARQAKRKFPLMRIAGTHTDADIYYADGCLWQKDMKLLEMADCPALAGAHNGQNAAAALAIGRKLGLDMRTLTDSLASFAGLAHRLQPVARHGEVRFVNDSKATNAEATRHALAAFDNIYWIVGGVAKAGGLAGLNPFYGHVRAAYLIGEAADIFAAELQDSVPTHMAGTLEQALMQAADEAYAEQTDATVLLSPACASFDQFENFEARGAAFCAAVETWCSAQKGGAA